MFALTTHGFKTGWQRFDLWLEKWWLVGLLGCFWLGTGWSLFSPHHFLRNLEPYPDGLYYVMPAQQFVRGQGLLLQHQQQSLKVHVPPLYSLVLVPGAGLFGLPESFVLTNIALGSLAVVLVAQAAVAGTGSWRWGAVAGVVYLVHGYIWWFVSLPMSENLSLLLIAFLLWQMARSSQRRWEMWLVGLATGGLVLTRYSLLPTAVVVGLLFWLRWWRSSRPADKLWLVAGWWLSGMVLAVYQFSWLGTDPTTVLKPQYEAKSAQTITAFSWEYVPANFKFYLWSLLGATSRVLWQNQPLTSLPAMVVAVGGGLVMWWQHRQRWLLSLAAGICLAQLAIVLPFYSGDGRYVLPIIPVVAVVLGVVIGQLWQTKRKWSWVVAAVVLVSLVLSQRGLYRQLIAANILHRTEAWQYQSIQVFNAFFQSRPDSYLVTVLPPYLVDLYQTANYQLLPLSPHQEFMNPSQRPWGELNYQDLSSEYQQLLSAGKQVYVTNAYLSSQHIFEDDWQRLQTQFRLEPVGEGCLKTCALYRLHQW